MNNTSFADYETVLGYCRSQGPALTLEQVSVQCQKNTILDHIDLTFAAGKTTAIVGPNGSGKSTLIKAILGQYTHTGNIQIAWPCQADARIAYVPQHIDFDRELPMNEKDFLGMLLQRRPIFCGLDKHYRDIVCHLLEKVAMLKPRPTKIGKLSGGQLKRMLLIQALYPEPNLLLLDEPMASLDEPGVFIFKTILRDLQAMGKTIIWVEHDFRAVKRWAHHLVALNKTVLYTGYAEDLSNPDLVMNIFSHHRTHRHHV